MNAQLQQLIDWGYRVDAAQETGGVAAYYVAGFGVAQYVRDDDAVALAALTDPAVHAERVQQSTESSEETQARWVREGKLPAPYPSDTV